MIKISTKAIRRLDGKVRSLRADILFLVDKGTPRNLIVKEALAENTIWGEVRKRQYSPELVNYEITQMLQEGVLVEDLSTHWIVVAEWSPNEARKIRKSNGSMATKSRPKEIHPKDSPLSERDALLMQERDLLLKHNPTPEDLAELARLDVAIGDSPKASAMRAWIANGGVGEVPEGLVQQRVQSRSKQRKSQCSGI
jgi:hypothetical protein